MQVFLNLTLGMTKLKVLVLCFFYFTDNSIMSFCIFFWECWCQSIASNLNCVTIFSWVSWQAWNEYTLLFSMYSQIFVLLPRAPLELESYFAPWTLPLIHRKLFIFPAQILLVEFYWKWSNCLTNCWKFWTRIFFEMSELPEIRDCILKHSTRVLVIILHYK
jgi:hypothetical protein